MTSLIVETLCPGCKGKQYAGTDGYGNRFICEQCEGISSVYTVKQYNPSPAPPEQSEGELPE